MAQFSSQRPNSIQKIAVLTSGGDAPGMNAAIRAVARIGLQAGWQVEAIIGGYAGLLEQRFETLQSRNLANVIQRGGTFIKTGRCPEFTKTEVRAHAMGLLRQNQIDAMVVIGGDGSFTGAHALWQEHQFPIVGIPGTIDNDIDGTESTIGFDTAVNTALDAIDRIRDTATSHDRLFIVEVMGRDTGFIASHVGLAGGAEEIFAPEHPVSVDKVVEKIRASLGRGKKSSILVTAEGQKPGRAYDLAEQIRKKLGLESKVCILGHMQRGGSPTAFDRILATRMGARAIDFLQSGTCDVMTGLVHGEIVATELSIAIRHHKQSPKEFLQLASKLAL